MTLRKKVLKTFLGRVKSQHFIIFHQYFLLFDWQTIHFKINQSKISSLGYEWKAIHSSFGFPTILIPTVNGFGILQEKAICFEVKSLGPFLYSHFTLYFLCNIKNVRLIHAKYI